MIRIATLRLIDYVVLGISGASFLVFLGCALYTIPWNRHRRKQVLTKDFNLFWKTRLCLQVCSAFWMLFQWLRLEALWQPGSHIFDTNVTNRTGGGQLCRLYICISMGLLEPFCLFTAVLLCRNVLSTRSSQSSGWPNTWVMSLALIMTLPFLAAQVVLAWMSVIIPGHDWERTSGPSEVGRYFLAPYVIGTDQQCDNSDGQTCLLCFFPAASSCVGIIQGLVAALMLWLFVRRVLAAVINRRLRRRLHCFHLSFFAGLIALNTLRAVTVARGTPFSLAFQITWLVHFVSIPFVASVYTLFLVLIPVWDTVKISKSIQKLEKESPPAANENKDLALEHSSSKSTSPARSPQTDSERIEDTLLDVREQSKV